MSGADSNFGGSPSGKPAAQEVKDRAASEAQAAKDKAAQATKQASAALHDAGKDLKQQAKAAGAEVQEAAVRATDKAKTRLAEEATVRKEAVAEHMGAFGAAARDAADRLKQEDDSAAAHYLYVAADGLDRASDRLRNADLGELYEDAEQLARKHPEIVLGGLFLVGIGIARFLKSSAKGRRREQYPSLASSGQRPVGSPYADPMGQYRATPSAGVRSSNVSGGYPVSRPAGATSSEPGNSSVGRNI